MSPTLKKVLLVILLLLVAGGIAFAIWWVFFPPAPGSVYNPSTGTTTTGQLPGSNTRPTGGNGGTGGEAQPGSGSLPTAGAIPSPSPSFFRQVPVTKVVTEFADHPSLNNSSGNLRYQNPSDGKFYRTLPDGSVKELSDQAFYNVQNVTWAKTKDKAVLEYPDGSKIVYDFDNKKQVTLPRHWEEFSFSPEGDEIAAKSIGLSPENRWLVTTKDDGTGIKLIEPMGEFADKVTVDWSPSRQTVALSQTGEAAGADRREVLFVGLHGENFKSTVVEGLDFMSQWSPTGKKLLYSVDSARSDFKPELWVANAYGDEIGTGRQALKINTWADKCSFGDDTTLFCAVPRDLPVGAGMSPTVADNSIDDLYKIDLKTGAKIPLSLGQTNYHINTLFYDKAHNKVFFTDKNQKGVFEVRP